MRHIKQDPNVTPENLRKIKLFMLGNTLCFVIFILGWVIKYTIYDFLTSFLLGFFWLVPSFLTNALMPLMSNIKGIKRYPIDGGRIHKDGNRVLGEGKSWNGAIGGIIVGFIISAALAYYIYPKIELMTMTNFSDGTTVLEYLTKEEILAFVAPSKNPIRFYGAVFMLCLGCPLGDGLGSYYKRRKGINRGDLFLFWDQNDFLLASIVLSYAFFPLKWYYIVGVVLFTPFMTTLANIIGYYIGKKNVPY